MQLTVFTDYGLRCLMFLASRDGGSGSVKEIADYYGISRNHLVKVVHRLGQLGYITTSKGKGGGIKLARAAETYRLGDLIEELEPNMNLVECFGNTNACRVVGTCRLKSYLFNARTAFVHAMNEYTLADTLLPKDELITLQVR